MLYFDSSIDILTVLTVTPGRTPDILPNLTFFLYDIGNIVVMETRVVFELVLGVLNPQPSL